MANKTAIPYFDFQLAPEDLKEQWRKAVIEEIEEFDFIRGTSVTRFENSWAEFVGTKYALGVGNGYDGLVLALRALNLEPGFTVVVPAHTFIATWNAVHFAGGKPVGIDVDINGNLDLKKLEELNFIPDVVIPVHMHGRMIDMHRLCAWANLNNVKVIEDASQAHGAKLHGIAAGAWSEISVFSLYPSKNLGAFGDAGVICTNNFDTFSKLQSLGNYGSVIGNKYKHDLIGINSRLDSIQARLLSVNLNHLESWNNRRKEIASIYLSGINNDSRLTLPTPGGDENVWHHFPIRHSERDRLQLNLYDHQIKTEIHYPYAAGEEFTKLMKQTTSFPLAAEISNSTLSLPISPWHTNSQINRVIECINAFNS